MTIDTANIVNAIMQVTIPENIDHHYSDFYCKVTPETTKIINQYEYKSSVTTFIDNINNELWYDIPFVYTGR